MRDAEQILFHYRDDSKFPYITEVIYTHSDMVEAINEARAEAIKEAAEVADRYSDCASKEVLNLLNNIQ